MAKSKKIWKFYKVLLYLLPAALVCSYFPVIRIGGNETMNFELSLTLIWLVVFDAVVMIMIVREKKWREIIKNWRWLLLPLFLTCSVLWSLNFLRGLLTVGVLWLVYLAGYGMVSFRKMLDEEFWRKFWWWFFGTFLVVCGICLVQCVLDILGVSREVTQMCEGCSYTMFGFSHPNGFAIEPQFMGNLLLAPVIIIGYAIIQNGIFGAKAPAFGERIRGLVVTPTAPSKCHFWIMVGLFLTFTTTLFLTFSRGAIYAFGVAMVVMIIVVGVKYKLWKWGLLVLGLAVVSFLMALNLQGIMAAVSKTNDTYFSGVAKVVNQLSLGVIDLQNVARDESADDLEEENASVFDGYVEESTNTRMRLTKAGLKIFASDFKTVMIGVGLGGAGQALYNNDLSPAPKEIVQNEYVSLLLETGIIGFLLFVYTMYLVIKAVVKSPIKIMLLTLLLAYGITLCFFSGLPNALQIYLMPAVVYVAPGKKILDGKEKM